MLDLMSDDYRAFTVYLQDIDWCVEEEDVEDIKDIAKIKSTLPKALFLGIPEYNGANFEDRDELEEVITNSLSNHYGWLVNSYNYEVQDIR